MHSSDRGMVFSLRGRLFFSMINNMKKLFLLLSIMACTIVGAQDPGFDEQNSQTVSVTRNDDGSRTIYKKRPGEKGMQRRSYSADGNLISVVQYREGEYGQLVSCKIYDGQKTELYKVSYGYDKNARLVEERMFDSATGQAVRRFIYTYDAMGNRSKPVVVTLVKGNFSKVADPTAPEIDPFKKRK